MLTQTGSELDALGYLYSMKRRSGESDQDYRGRLEIRRLRIGAKYGGRERDVKAFGPVFGRTYRERVEKSPHKHRVNN